MKDPLFEPIQIGKVQVKNRIYMPAMHLNMAENFQVTDRIVEFYRERALGGTGMIAVGYATVDDLSGNTLNIGAHSDEFIPGLKRLSSAIKENGAISVVQLNHAGRYNFSFFLNGKEPVAPSAVASRLTKETPKAMDQAEISRTIENFAAAAARVKTAGFEAVEILSGTGYLISQFLSPLTNKREDEYGGPLENRMRFGVEVVQAVRAAVGDDFPLIVRMNGNEFMPGGLTNRELRTYAAKLSDEGVDALCINVGWHEARVPQIVSSVPRGAFAYLTRAVREVVSVPVIASHRINDPQLARELIADHMCDMAAVGRGLIADPFFAEKARSGREREIIHCIACAQGCFDHIFKLKPVECMCNPRAGHEVEKAPAKTGSPKKIMIVGGGPAGMSAAIAASERGHDATLYESGNRLGGQLHLAAAPPGREEFLELAGDLETQLAVKKIKVVINKNVDESLIDEEKPDAVIVATGAVPIAPPIPGSDLNHVVQAWDVLQGDAFTGERVVVVGGGAVGVETALFLAEKGKLSGDVLKFLFINKAEDVEDLYRLSTVGAKKITVVEMIESVGKDIGKSTRWGMMQDMERSRIEVRKGTKAVKIVESGIIVETDGKEEEIPADTIVIGVGSASFDPLGVLLDQKGIPHITVGDASKPGKAFDAVHDGYKAGNTI